MVKLILGMFTAVAFFILLLCTGCTMADDDIASLDYPVCTAKTSNMILVVSNTDGTPMSCDGLYAFVRAGGLGSDCLWTSVAQWDGCNDGVLYGHVVINSAGPTVFGITLFANEKYVTHTMMSQVIEEFTKEVVIETRITTGEELYWNGVMTH